MWEGRYHSGRSTGSTGTKAWRGCEMTYDLCVPEVFSIQRRCFIISDFLWIIQKSSAVVKDETVVVNCKEKENSSSGVLPPEEFLQVLLRGGYKCSESFILAALQTFLCTFV